MSAPLLRPAAAEDLEAVAALYGDLYCLLRGFGLPYALEETGLRQVLPVLLTSSHCHFTVAEQDGRLVGFLSAGIMKIDRKLSFQGEALTGFINDLYLAPDYRRGGLGQAMLRRAENWFRESGVILAQCNVMAGNEAGAAFWARQGYQELGRILYKSL